MLPLVLLTIFASLPTHGKDFRFVDSTFCPLVCDSTIDGKEGYLIDILRDALATKNHTLTFEILPFLRAIMQVRAGEAHALPAIYQSDAPDLIVGETVIAPGRNVIFVRENFTGQYQGVESLSKLSIAVILGYTFGNDLIDNYISEAKKNSNHNVTFIADDKPYERLIQMLMIGRVDAIIDDSTFIYHALSNSSQFDTSLIKVIGVISEGENVVAYSPSLPEDSKVLLDIIDPFISDLYDSGGINKYVAPYGLKFENNLMLPVD